MSFIFICELICFNHLADVNKDTKNLSSLYSSGTNCSPNPKQIESIGLKDEQVRLCMYVILKYMFTQQYLSKNLQ